MKYTVRWSAFYETEIEVPDGENLQDAAANISIDVPGSIYQTDSWYVQKILDEKGEEVFSE